MPILKKNSRNATRTEEKGRIGQTPARLLAGGENGEVAVPGNPSESFF